MAPLISHFLVSARFSVFSLIWLSQLGLRFVGEGEQESSIAVQNEPAHKPNKPIITRFVSEIPPFLCILLCFLASVSIAFLAFRRRQKDSDSADSRFVNYVFAKSISNLFF